MTKYRQEFRIESARLREWDYANPWWYYVTINTKDHVEFFGKVENGTMILNEYGKIVEKCWEGIHAHYNSVVHDDYVIMPNHVHGIIIINETVETRHASSLQHKHITLSDVIGSSKSAVTKKIRESGNNNFLCQPRFYDRIIRNERELYSIRKYISENPAKWELARRNGEDIFDL